jgi:peptidoglycan hydrolase CwlO-like protein
MKRETLIIILFLLVIIICIFKNIRQKELFTPGTKVLEREDILDSLQKNVTDMNEILAHNVTNNTIDYIPHLDIIRTY